MTGEMLKASNWIGGDWLDRGSIKESINTATYETR